MPKQTFFNLPEKKRKAIVKAAIAEFASAGYDLSSIQQIIKASGISRGSFYQYFEDKADLFGEVMIEIAMRKMTYMQPVLDRDEDYGLFGLMKELVKAGVKFGIEDPEAFHIGKAVTASKTLDMVSFFRSFKQQVYERVGITEESLYLTAIQNSFKRGEIDTRYSIETVMLYTNQAIESMAERYWSHMVNKNDIHEGDMILDEMIHFLRYGLSSTNQPGQEAGNYD